MVAIRTRKMYDQPKIVWMQIFVQNFFLFPTPNSRGMIGLVATDDKNGFCNKDVVKYIHNTGSV